MDGSWNAIESGSDLFFISFKLIVSLNMNKIPDMIKPTHVPVLEEHVLKYQDGHSRKVYVTNDQFYLTSTMMIFSRADVDGFITHVNLPFVEASGWTKEELIGQPHYMLRHPHMPASIFAEMWQTLKSGQQWTGCVKNLRKDGGFYWVRAVVDPIIEDGKIVGFNSVRRRIDNDTIQEHEALYAQIRSLG